MCGEILLADGTVGGREFTKFSIRLAWGPCYHNQVQIEGLVLISSPNISVVWFHCQINAKTAT
jgi:hypothetical protein